MKKILYVISFFALALAGCLKDNTINTDGFNKTGTYLEIENAGVDFFSQSAILSADTIVKTFTVNLAATNTLASDLTITIGLNDAARTAYNSSNVGLQYLKLPDSAYSIGPKTGIIKAGQRLVSFTVTFYPKKIDPTVNYMVAVGILDAQGQTISGNFGSIYYHFIGNPLAGAYVWDFTRYSAPSNAGSPDGNSFTGHSSILSPVSGTALEVKSGYYIGPRYEITFTNTGGVLSDMKVTLNADDVTTMAGAGVVVTSGPVVDKADFVNKIFTFHYVTLSRYVIDSFHK